MASGCTSSGLELLVRLDRDSTESLTCQIQSELRTAIQTGRLAAGERVPSTRQLARDLGVSRGLVVDCYGQLRAEGYLEGTPGSATRVARCTSATSYPTRRAPNPEVPALDVDFAPRVPDLNSFPMRDWQRSMNEAWRSATTASFNYGDPRGQPELRRTLASYLGRVRAIIADSDLIVVCAGFTQGLNLVFAALHASGHDSVAVEDPGDRDNDTIARRNGLTSVAVPVDEHGIDVAALACTTTRAVVLTPAHQSPTGVILSPDRRRAVIDWARTINGVIIEDDYDAELRYDRRPVGSLQGVAPDRVISVGTVSKSLAPTLRLGWIVSPPGLIEALSTTKEFADRGSPGLDQLTLSHLIETGRFDRHLRRKRDVYSKRRAALVAALNTHAPRLGVSGLAAGLHLVAHLPDETDETHVIEQARTRGVGLVGMNHYRTPGTIGPPRLVLGYGNITPNAIAFGIDKISNLIDRAPSDNVILS